jgi:hypothetical protein
MATAWRTVSDRYTYQPVHAALLHTGKVLTFSGSGNDPRNQHELAPHQLFDPATEKITSAARALPSDVFCAGHSFMADGKLLVAGGTSGYDGPQGIFPPFRGDRRCYLYDADGDTWSPAPSMRYPRWYPSLVRRGDGTHIALAGLTAKPPWMFLRQLESYDGNGWRVMAGAKKWLPLFPRLHLLPDGQLFYSGAYNTHLLMPIKRFFPSSLYDPSTNRWKIIGAPKQYEREEAASILLPLTPPAYEARVVLIGGGTTKGHAAMKDIETILPLSATPSWQSCRPMAVDRYYCYTVMLPDGKVLILGGRGGFRQVHPRDVMPCDDPMPDPEHKARLEVELYDPESDQPPIQLEPMTYERMYHSVALLLPSGKVMIAGSNPMRGCFDHRIEIFTPPYLRGGVAQPVIRDVPATLSWGAKAKVELDAGPIDRIALISPASTTHCIDNDQRYVVLATKSIGGTTVEVDVPSNRNVLPPGYYMMFALRRGVPSVARFVRIGD